MSSVRRSNTRGNNLDLENQSSMNEKGNYLALPEPPIIHRHTLRPPFRSTRQDNINSGLSSQPVTDSQGQFQRVSAPNAAHPMQIVQNDVNRDKSTLDLLDRISARNQDKFALKSISTARHQGAQSNEFILGNGQMSARLPHEVENRQSFTLNRTVSGVNSQRQGQDLRSVTMQPSALLKLQAAPQQEEKVEPSPRGGLSPESRQKLNAVRVGKGITGVGVANISPHISGRLTLGMIYKMREKRQDAEFEIKDDNELARVKQLLRKKEKLKEKKEVIAKEIETGKFTEIQLRQNMKQIEREKQADKKEVISHLKDKFKHISGMWPKTAKFTNETQRMESWQTSLVIKRKIFKPSKRLIKCQEGVENMFQEHAKYERFLRLFRGGAKSKKVETSRNFRGSFAGSSVGTASNGGRETPRHMRNSVLSTQSRIGRSSTLQHQIQSHRSLIKFADSDFGGQNFTTAFNKEKKSIADLSQTSREAQQLTLKFKPENSINAPQHFDTLPLSPQRTLHSSSQPRSKKLHTFDSDMQNQADERQKFEQKVRLQIRKKLSNIQENCYNEESSPPVKSQLPLINANTAQMEGKDPEGEDSHSESLLSASRSSMSQTNGEKKDKQLKAAKQNVTAFNSNVRALTRERDTAKDARKDMLQALKRPKLKQSYIGKKKQSTSPQRAPSIPKQRANVSPKQKQEALRLGKPTEFRTLKANQSKHSSRRPKQIDFDDANLIEHKERNQHVLASQTRNLNEPSKEEFMFRTSQSFEMDRSLNSTIAEGTSPSYQLAAAQTQSRFPPSQKVSGYNQNDLFFAESAGSISREKQQNSRFPSNNVSLRTRNILQAHKQTEELVFVRNSDLETKQRDSIQSLERSGMRASVHIKQISQAEPAFYFPEEAEPNVKVSVSPKHAQRQKTAPSSPKRHGAARIGQSKRVTLQLQQRAKGRSLANEIATSILKTPGSPYNQHWLMIPRRNVQRGGRNPNSSHNVTTTSKPSQKLTLAKLNIMDDLFLPEQDTNFVLSTQRNFSKPFMSGQITGRSSVNDSEYGETESILLMSRPSVEQRKKAQMSSQGVSRGQKRISSLPKNIQT